MRKITAITAVLLMLISGAAIACSPPNPEVSAPKHNGISKSAEGEALVTVKVSEKIFRAKDRDTLTADLCAQIAKSVSADVVYISPIFDNGSGKPQNTTAHFKSSVLTTEKLIELLLKDKHIEAASPNYIRTIN
ncbi:MAG: hypothetical protein RR214_01525 [Synergistaceae bacterium]